MLIALCLLVCNEETHSYYKRIHTLKYKTTFLAIYYCRGDII